MTLLSGDKVVISQEDLLKLLSVLRLKCSVVWSFGPGPTCRSPCASREFKERKRRDM